MLMRTAFAAILAGALMPAPSLAAVQAPRQVWLSCKWHEVWRSLSFLGATSSEDTSEHDYARVYVYTDGSEYLREYDNESHELQVVVGTAITDDAILIEIKNQFDDPGLGGHSQFDHLWTLSRKTLNLSVIFTSSQDLQMGDGRVSSARTTGSGSGSCAIVDPQPIAPEQPNKF
jgi:hypothetical protein